MWATNCLLERSATFLLHKDITRMLLYLIEKKSLVINTTKEFFLFNAFFEDGNCKS